MSAEGSAHARHFNYFSYSSKLARANKRKTSLAGIYFGQLLITRVHLRNNSRTHTRVHTFPRRHRDYAVLSRHLCALTLMRAYRYYGTRHIAPSPPPIAKCYCET